MKNILTFLCFAGASCLPAVALASTHISLAAADIPYATWHKMILPNELLSLDVPDNYQVSINGETIEDDWRAPNEAGTHSLEITDDKGSPFSQVTLFVLEPSSNIDARGYLGDYRIGAYPKDTPAGFIKVEKDDVSHLVSPNFKIGQFLCKQQPDVWPKYVLVSDSNLNRLETLLATLKAEGRTDADSLYVMSGFRTPFYNRTIKASKFSRHMYGDAADVYIDSAPRDGAMDDINTDGKIDKEDANFLYDYAQALYQKTSVKSGGLGSYKANAVHGPFVHIDARGRTARWGR